MNISSTGLSDEEEGVTRVAYSFFEVATMFGVSEASVWRATRRGDFEKITLGGRSLITARSVRRAAAPKASDAV